jgi:hypothetical protein
MLERAQTLTLQSVGRYLLSEPVMLSKLIKEKLTASIIREQK